MRLRPMIALAVLLAVAGCGPGPEVTYAPPGDSGRLTVYVGPGSYREILQRAAAQSSIRVELVDAPKDANAQLAAGHGDLAFYQHVPAFQGSRPTGLSIVSRVDVKPYALYSSKWRDLRETRSWVNTGLVDDRVSGASLPHGALVALPSTPTGFARGLYLLQHAGLLRLDQPFGGTTVPALTITQANVVASPRHLDVRGIAYTDLPAIYAEFDAVVLSPEQAATLHLVPAERSLAIEPGPGNPYTHVLVAPARLAGDQRVLALVHALESPDLARFLATRYRGADIPASSTTPTTPTTEATSR